MEHPLKALFENAGLIRNGKPIIKYIRKLKASHIIDVCQQSTDITHYTNINASPSIFSHAAAPSLGGSSYPCSSPSCRIEKIRELTQFAALYSDKVFIKNYFTDLLAYADRKPANLEAFFRYKFLDDLIVFCELLPLIESDIVQMVSFGNVCPHCLCIDALSQDKNPRYNVLSDALRRRFLKEVAYSLIYKNDEMTLISSGPDSILPHGLWCHTYLIQDEIYSKAPRLVEQVKKCGIIKLTTDQAKKLKAHNIPFTPLIHNIAFELGVADLLKTSFLSD